MNTIDKKDCMILGILQENCRESLTHIAKKVNLSIDSVNKRILKMIRNDVFHTRIQLRPRNFGFNTIVDVRIQLKYEAKENMEKFLNFLISHPRVIQVFTTSGNWDLSIVIIATDALDLGSITNDIKYRFGSLINSWTETLTTDSLKFEQYDVLELMKSCKKITIS